MTWIGADQSKADVSDLTANQVFFSWVQMGDSANLKFYSNGMMTGFYLEPDKDIWSCLWLTSCWQ